VSFELPDSAYPRCLQCGGPAKPSPRLLHEIVGYTRPRNAGGANHIIARRETGRVVCARCAETVQSGAEGQEALL
jgi:hypothetical protein